MSKDGEVWSLEFEGQTLSSTLARGCGYTGGGLSVYLAIYLFEGR